VGQNSANYGVSLSEDIHVMRIQRVGNRVFCLVAPILLRKEDPESLSGKQCFLLRKKVRNLRVYVERSGVELQKTAYNRIFTAGENFGHL